MKPLRVFLLIFLVFMVNGEVNATSVKVSRFDQRVYFLGSGGVSCVQLGFLDDLLGAVRLEGDTGFSGHVGLGYKINRYVALELGATSYPSVLQMQKNQ